MKKIAYFLFFMFVILISGCSAYKQDEFETEQQPIQTAQEMFHLDQIQTVLFNYGDILINTFKQTRLSEQDANAILKHLQKMFNVNKCKPNDYYEVTYSQDGSWSVFNYFPQDIYYYSLKKSTDNVITCDKIELQTVKKTLSAGGTIENSLWEAMALQKLKPDVIMSFADIFASKIDFLTEVRKGDTFKVVYEVDLVEKTNTIISAKILAGQYSMVNSTFTAILYKNTKGNESYFDEEGHSLKKAFLKAPLQFTRISSFFTKKRFHPILKYYRPHEGIDYAAPTGTPVSSVADGIVTKSQPSGGYGNLIIVRHPNGYETYYGHLSRYAKGVRRGVKVKQGQIIGFVGMTGTATGPHLDFRIKSNGKFFNFLKMKMPASLILKGQDKDLFKIRRDIAVGDLNKIEIEQTQPVIKTIHPELKPQPLNPAKK